MGRDGLEDMVAAGEEVMEIERLLAKTEDNVVGELLKGQGTFYEWNHYPDGDVYDADTGSQFFYHAHPADERIGEHGHFHTFLRPVGMPTGVCPASLPDLQLPKDENDALTHLIGISMDSWGKATRLFTTNRWVTGEVWYGAEDVIAMAALFEIGHSQPSWPVNRWLNALFRLYLPDIEALVRERDTTMGAWKNQPLPIDEETGAPVSSVFENRQLEVTSYLKISVPDRLATVVSALEKA
ncbi:MAG: hypothetical protein E2O90_10555 [Alphaproteobacteria bacterium]|nr:MAG: hypothetical protein E2O90_10555 [Alphaproteobacteria bacterium]